MTAEFSTAVESTVEPPAGATGSTETPRLSGSSPEVDEQAESLCYLNSYLSPRSSVSEPSPDVWLHIYHCDPYTGFLNRVILKQAEIGIYHAGVEIFGEEWSFQYFEDTWNDPSVSGLIRCMPKCMTDYEYQESINLGPTPFSETEVYQLILTLQYEWSACSYHLTHNNCLTFAEVFTQKLQAPRPFPAWIKGILDASRKSSSMDAAVDYGWSWAKWWMIRKHQQPNDDEPITNPADYQQEDSFWNSLFQPGNACSGATMCPGSRTTIPENLVTTDVQSRG